jgi:hypothetical protein
MKVSKDALVGKAITKEKEETVPNSLLILTNRINRSSIFSQYSLPLYSFDWSFPLIWSSFPFLYNCRG